MRRFGPKQKGEYLATCPICERQFQEGDYTTLIATPTPEEKAASARNITATEVCWDHAPAIFFITGEPIEEPDENLPARIQP